jgi:hypothetical protein
MIATSFAAACGIALLAVVPNASAQDIHDGLVVHLTFDGDVLDHSGRGNDGMIMRPEANPDPFVAGIITNNRTMASAFRTLGDFLGANMPTNNYITLGVPAPGSDLDFGDGTDITFSFWGKYAQDGAYWDPAWISNKNWTNASNIGYVLAYQGVGWIDPNTGGFHWNYKTDTSVRSDSMRCKDCHLDNEQWHHYVVSFTRGDPIDLGGHGNMYIDGILLEEVPLNVTGSLDAGLAINIMQDGLGTYTDTNNGSVWKDALISDVGIWRRAITQDEVTTIYQLGLQGISALD